MGLIKTQKEINEEFYAANAAYTSAIQNFRDYIAAQERVAADSSSSTLQSEQSAKSHIPLATLKSMEQEVERVITKLKTDEYYSKNPQRAANVKQVMTRALTATQNYAIEPNEKNTKEFSSSRREVGRLGTIGAGVFGAMSTIAMVTFFVGLALTVSGVGGLLGFWLMMGSFSLLTFGNGLTSGPFMMFKGKELEDRALVKGQMVNVERDAEATEARKYSVTA